MDSTRTHTHPASIRNDVRTPFGLRLTAFLCLAIGFSQTLGASPPPGLGVGEECVVTAEAEDCSAPSWRHDDTAIAYLVAVSPTARLLKRLNDPKACSALPSVDVIYQPDPPRLLETPEYPPNGGFTDRIVLVEPIDGGATNARITMIPDQVGGLPTRITGRVGTLSSPPNHHFGLFRDGNRVVYEAEPLAGGGGGVDDLVHSAELNLDESSPNESEEVPTANFNEFPRASKDALRHPFIHSGATTDLLSYARNGTVKYPAVARSRDADQPLEYRLARGGGGDVDWRDVPSGDTSHLTYPRGRLFGASQVFVHDHLRYDGHSRVSLLPGTGGGSFGVPVALPTFDAPVALAVVNANGDSQSDLAVACQPTSHGIIQPLYGSTVFSRPSADLDGHGD